MIVFACPPSLSRASYKVTSTPARFRCQAAPKPAHPEPTTRTLRCGFLVFGESELVSKFPSAGHRATDEGGILLIPATHSLIQVPQQHSMDWISALGSQLSYPVATHSMLKQPHALPAPTPAPSSSSVASPQKPLHRTNSTENEGDDIAVAPHQQRTPTQSPMKAASSHTPNKQVSTPVSTGETRSGRKHVRFAPDDEISQILFSPSKKPRVEEIATAHAVLHGHVYNHQPVSAKKPSTKAWASFDRKGRSRPELKRIRPTLIQQLEPST